MAHELAHVVQQEGRHAFVQRMIACPTSLRAANPVPPGWKPYFGSAAVFHCGFRGILEDRRPTPSDPQNECSYDHSGTLVDERHPFSGCRGTPNQYDSSTSTAGHIFIDSGGIVRSGAPAFFESRLYDLSRPVSAAIEALAAGTVAAARAVIVTGDIVRSLAHWGQSEPRPRPTELRQC